MAKYKHSSFVSPVGEADMTWLDKPSPPFQPGAKEQYKTRLILDDTAENRAWVQKVYEKALVEAKEAGIKLKKVHNTFFTLPEDADEDDFIVQEGKKYAKYPEHARDKIIIDAKSTFKPALIDTAKESLPEDVKIYGRDLIRIKVTVNPYVSGANNGISLYLNVAQLVEKKTSFSGGGAADLDDFDDIDGYRSQGEDGEGNTEEDF